MDLNELYSMMNNGETDDPRLKMLSLMLEQQKEKGEADNSTKAQKLKDYIQRLILHIKQLKKSNTELVNNVAYLLSRNDTLTAALGTCSECLGEDPNCNVCYGEGKPGNYEISVDLYNHFIQPCIKNHPSEELLNSNNHEGTH